MSEPQPAPEEFPRTVSQESTAEIEVRKSRFLAFLAPCRSKEEAVAYLGILKKTYWDAVHHCYAYRIGAEGLEYRMSDDGEPSGTAGKPLLFCLQRAKITNSIVVVVRYFGGVKLGVGPLARAYSDAANHVISSAPIEEIIPMEELEIHCLYDDVSRIISLLEEVEAAFSPTYADAVTFHVSVPAHRVGYLTDQVVERTSARAGFSKVRTE